MFSSRVGSVWYTTGLCAHSKNCCISSGRLFVIETPDCAGDFFGVDLCSMEDLYRVTGSDTVENLLIST